MKQTYRNCLTNGIIKENPIFRLMLGLCPVLAVSTSAIDALGMGLATTFVLSGSNVVISIFRRKIPLEIRIPVFIVVISTFVTVVDYLMLAFFPVIHQSLGVFVPLIVVNCIVLGRAEAFASRNPVIPSLLDGLGTGAGFVFAIGILGTVREVIGNGTLFGVNILGAAYEPFLLMILPPGAFILIGIVMAVLWGCCFKK